MKKGDSMGKRGESCCEKTPRKYKGIKQFLSESTDSNKVLGNYKNVSLFLTEISIGLLLVMVISNLVLTNINDLKLIYKIIISSIFFLLSAYFIIPPIYQSKYLYLDKIKKHLIINIIITIVYLVVYLYFLFRIY